MVCTSHRFEASLYLLAREFSSWILTNPLATCAPASCKVTVSKFRSLKVSRRHDVCGDPSSTTGLDVRRCLPEEALAFYEQLREPRPPERFAFLVGPPRYLSLTWPDEFCVLESETPQWGETVKRFLAAA